MQRNCLEVQSLQRAVDILEFIGNNPAPVSLKTITNSVQLPKSTVYRMLSNLELRGYICCGNDGGYRLGYKFMMMGQRVEQGFEVKHLARPHMSILNNSSKESVHLAVLNKGRVLYVDTFDSPLPVRLVAKIGGTNSVHCTALGKALLSGHNDAQIEEILAEHGMEKRTRFTLETPQQFLVEMEAVRRQGYAFDYRESDLECSCISAPVYNYQGKVVAAISVSGPVNRFGRDMMVTKVAPKLLAAAQTISQALGSPSGGL